MAPRVVSLLAGSLLGWLLVACGGEPQEAIGDGDDTAASDDDAGGGPGCGNGRVDEGEACDDANDSNIDGCTNACLAGPQAIVPDGDEEAGAIGNGSGSEVHEHACPDGQVVVGLAGQLADRFWLASVRTQCGRPTLVDELPLSVDVATGDSLGPHGGSGTVDWGRMCEPGEVVVGFDARAGMHVDQVTLWCAPLALHDGAEGWTLLLGDDHPLTPVGGETGEAPQPVQCSGGWVATTVVVVAGTAVDALGLRCSALGLQ